LPNYFTIANSHSGHCSKHRGAVNWLVCRNCKFDCAQAGLKLSVASSKLRVQRSAVSALRPFSSFHALILRLATLTHLGTSALKHCSCAARAARWDRALQSAKFKVQQVLSGGVPKFNVQSRGRGIQRSGILRRALLRLAVLAPWRFPPRSSP